MKSIFIHHHLGLGDHIICNGLVRFFAEKYKVNLFCKKNNFHNVSIMFSDNQNISIIPVDDDSSVMSYRLQQTNFISIGVALNSAFDRNSMLCSWDKVFYDQVNIPFDISWSGFSFHKPSYQHTLPSEPYAFICDKGSDGISGIDESTIDTNLLRVYSNKGYFFDNIDLIQNATEVHSINSSYIHFVDRIKTINNSKLFYHKHFIEKPYSDFTLKKEWIIV